MNSLEQPKQICINEARNKRYYPLSGIQQQFYLLDKLVGTSGAYNLLTVIKIDGLLNIDKLNNAFQVLILRHESLRTSFKVIGSKLYQKIHDKVESRLDFKSATEKELENCIQNFSIGFNLSEPPLIRALLVETILREQYYLAINIHHILADDRSLHIILQDLLALYFDEELPETKINYKDYSYHHNKLLKQDFFLRHEKFWQEKFNKQIADLDLPYDFPAPSINNYFGSDLNFSITNELLIKLKNLAISKKTSLYSLLLSIYSILLAKYSQQNAIVIGCSMENRQYEGVKNIVGAFVNTLPIICFATADKNFSQFWEEVKNDLLNTIEYQDYPCINVNQLCKILNGGFNTIFDFHVERIPTIEKGRLTFNTIHLPSTVSKFPLSLEAVLKQQSIIFTFEYNSDLFKTETINNLRDYFIHLIELVTTNPNIMIGEISLTANHEYGLVPENKVELLTSQPLIKNSTFLDLFNKQLAISPYAIAVSSDIEQITYLELDQKSTQLANYLIDSNIIVEDIVAVVIERSINLLISLLGILKAGAVYLPIDKNSPKAKIKDVIEVSKCKYVLTNGMVHDDNSKESIIDLFEHQVILDLEHIKHYDKDKLNKQVTLLLENLAYIIFTSGSTGKPKGVMLTHSGMLNHLLAKINDLELSSTDIIAQTSSMIFDVSIWQFLVGLLVGSKVVIIKDEHAWQPPRLIASIVKNKITIFETVPSHINLILSELKKSLYKLYDTLPLRYLIINGEPLLPTICNNWLSYYNEVKIINAYGPTECSDDVTHYNFNANMKYSYYVPIGRVINNMFLYILDNDLNLVPPGIQAELYVSGIGIARGYLNNPEATAAAFLPLSSKLKRKNYSYKDGDRIYKTGDIVKYADNNIEYIGRKDRQIKILGNRVELGEIESTIQKQELVSQVVATIAGENSEKYIIVYLTIRQESIDQITNFDFQLLFRKYSINNLPSHMIPKYFIILEKIPLLSNGKVDFNSLPKPEITKIISISDTPSSKLEQIIAIIWQTTLEIDTVGININFFEAGGNSLLALQVILRIAEELKIDISLRDFFSTPTIKAIAELAGKLLSQSEVQNQYAVTIPQVIINHQDLYQPFPVTDVQQAYLIGRTGIYDLGNVSVHIYSEYESTPLNIKKLEWAWNQLIRRHGALRTIFPTYNSQIILNTVPFYKIDILDLEDVDNEESLEQKLLEIRNAKSHFIFPLNQWPLFEISAVKLKGLIRIYLSFDVLIMDGWSTDILFKELYELYHNPDHHLPDLELTFRDYVLAIEHFKTSKKYNRDKKYWLSRLEQFPGIPDIPIINNKNALVNQKFVRISDRIDYQAWNNIKQHIKHYKLSLTGFVATVFTDILRRFSNNEHFVINLTIFDRMPIHREVNQIIGDFTSVLLLEANYSNFDLSTISFLNRCKHLQEQLWSDLEHSSFSGIEFIRELKNKYRDSDFSVAPIVLTSILGLDDPIGNKVNNLFGEEVYSISQTPQIWLDFKAFEIDEELIVEWDYVEGLFHPDFIKAMHKSYVNTVKLLGSTDFHWTLSPYFKLIKIAEATNQNTNLLTKVVCTEESLADISPPTAAYSNVAPDQSTLLPYKSSSEIEFCKKDNLLTDKGYKSLALLFEQTALRLLDKEAIISPTKTLTYHELLSYVKQLSFLLNSLCMVPNKLIGIIMHKSWQQVAACLGVLNIRIPYLPIDPELPKLRIQEILEISDVQAIITLDQYIADLSAYYSGPIINFNTVKDTPTDCLLQPLVIEHDENDLAYVIFTSGSTGIPKGVVIKQAAVLNTLLDINSKFNISSNDKVLSISNLSFDLSVYDIFGLLISGGTIIIPDYQKLKDPYHWLELLMLHKVTIWNTTPMLMQMLLEAITKSMNLDNRFLEKLAYVEGSFGDTLLRTPAYSYVAMDSSTGPACKSPTEVEFCKRSNKLRLILLSGDWIPVKLPNLIMNILQTKNSKLQIIGLGGATEASIWSSIYEIKPSAFFDKTIPYGFPLKNQNLYILSDSLELCPIWVTGELCIGGLGIANGYWKDEKKTEQQFINHPNFGRLYRTGDLCRYMSNGAVEIIGRKDSQIKIDGIRIETGEIEAILKNHISIVTPVVLPFTTESGSKKIAAYIVLKKGDPLSDSKYLIHSMKNSKTHSNHSNNLTIAQLSQKQIPILNNSIQEILPTEYYRCKSYRQFNGENKLTKQELISWLSNLFHEQDECHLHTNAINTDSLTKLLQAFLPCYDHSALKYRYPSAGSLYPVKLYLLLPDILGNINKGIYFVNTAKGFLEFKNDISEQFFKVNKNIRNQEFYLYFTVDKNIIEPIYGDTGIFLGILESGYMLRLLEKVCRINGWSAIETREVDNNRIADVDFCLKDDEILVTSVKIISNFEEKLCVQDHSIITLIYIKPGEVEGIKGGWYKFDEQLELRELGDIAGMVISPSINDTYSIYSDSSLAILFFLPNSDFKMSDKELTSKMIEVGKLAQRLRDSAIKYHIGTCPIGNLFIDNKEELSGIEKYGIFSHCVFAGRITDQQLSSKGASSYKLEVFKKDLLDYLKEKLPKYMIPQSITILENIPISSNGKIDRNLLPKPNFVAVSNNISLPNNSTEERLFQIWQDVLKIDKDYISTDSSFFELGGNSLLLIEIHNRITNELLTNISIVELFQSPTIVGQAKRIKQLNSKNFEEVDLKHLQSIVDSRSKKRRSHTKTYSYDTK